MDNKTKAFYADRVKETAALYETCTGQGISRHFPAAFHPGARILDIGAGTARDMLRLLDQGYDAFGIDASPDMVEHALRVNPPLKGKLKQGSIPSEKFFYDGEFDGILCSAVLMHIPDEYLFDSAFSIRNNLKPGGRLLLSVPVARPGIDDENRTDDGRLFVIRQPEYYTLLFERIGFSRIGYFEEDDGLGRDGVRWGVLIFNLDSAGGVRSLDKIEGIINRDKKWATYKLALFRALCDIALTEYNSVKWYDDGMVGVDLKSVADKWILYYWPLIESAEFKRVRFGV